MRSILFFGAAFVFLFCAASIPISADEPETEVRQASETYEEQFARAAVEARVQLMRDAGRTGVLDAESVKDKDYTLTKSPPAYLMQTDAVHGGLKRSVKLSKEVSRKTGETLWKNKKEIILTGLLIFLTTGFFGWKLNQMRTRRLRAQLETEKLQVLRIYTAGKLKDLHHKLIEGNIEAYIQLIEPIVAQYVKERFSVEHDRFDYEMIIELVEQKLISTKHARMLLHLVAAADDARHREKYPTLAECRKMDKNLAGFIKFEKRPGWFRR